jgi:hypothetical protein
VQTCQELPEQKEVSMSVAGTNKSLNLAYSHGTISMERLADDMRNVTRLTLFKKGIDSLDSKKENPENFLLVNDADLYVNLKTGEVALVKNT